MTQAAGRHPMRLERTGTTLLVVNIQERLFPGMDAEHRAEGMHHVKLLATTGRGVGLPTLVTEQYPKGLGHTLPELQDILGPEVKPIAKVAFSCGEVETVQGGLQRAATRAVV